MLCGAERSMTEHVQFNEGVKRIDIVVITIYNMYYYYKLI